MKTCKKCNIEKSSEDFNKDSKNKDGLWTICKECRLGHKPHKPILEGLKICITCKIGKSVECFSNVKSKGKDYLQSSCKSCRIKSQQTKRNQNPEKEAFRVRKRVIFYTYGIKHEEYELMYSKQEGKCLICNTYHKVLAIDHCHTSEAIRGLLCRTCNSGLGFFKDSSQLLQSAINYLKETNTDKS